MSPPAFSPSSMPNCTPKGVGPQKLKFLLRFDQNVKYKRPAGACLAEFVPHFRLRDVLKFLFHLLKGL